MKKIAILLSLIVFCLAQNNPRNNQSAVFEQISVVPQQNIVIDIEHSQLHNDSFISLSEYLKENKDNIIIQIETEKCPYVYLPWKIDEINNLKKENLKNTKDFYFRKSEFEILLPRGIILEYIGKDDFINNKNNKNI